MNPFTTMSKEINELIFKDLYESFNQQEKEIVDAILTDKYFARSSGRLKLAALAEGMKMTKTQLRNIFADIKRKCG